MITFKEFLKEDPDYLDPDNLDAEYISQEELNKHVGLSSPRIASDKMHIIDPIAKAALKSRDDVRPLNKLQRVAGDIPVAKLRAAMQQEARDVIL